MENNYFGARPEKPYHLSVGAILVSKMNEYSVLHYPKIGELSNIVKFPTGTVTQNETFEDALLREVREETGYESSIITYLGSQQMTDRWWGEINQETEVEKTTLFFLVKLKSKIVGATLDSKEIISNNVSLKKYSYQKLLRKFENQHSQDGIRDFNQQVFLRRAQKFLELHPIP